MKSNEFENIFCPIADALSVLGDKWSGLVLRDLMLGINRYSDFRASSNITNATLSNRLKTLEQNGLVQKQLYQTCPDRYEYHLTKQGQSMAWVMLALAKIGTQWNLSGWENVPLRFTNQHTGNPIRLTVVDDVSGQEVALSDLKVERDM